MNIEDCSHLKPGNNLILRRALKDIKKLKDVVGIFQIGSSVFSKDYTDIDVIVFFNKYFPPPEINEIGEKYKKTKLYVEGVSTKDENFNRSSKIFSQGFTKLKDKRLLYGKDPYKNKRISLDKNDLAAYLWYHYHLCNSYEIGFGGAFVNSLRALLTYAGKPLPSKKDVITLFRKTYPKLVKYLPKHPEKYLRDTNKSNFKNLYHFFEEAVRYIMEKSN